MDWIEVIWKGPGGGIESKKLQGEKVGYAVERDYLLRVWADKKTLVVKVESVISIALEQEAEED